MAKRRNVLRAVFLNVSVIVLGLAAAALLYALVASNFLPRPHEAGAAKSVPAGEDIVQLEVRNGCGISGLAATVTQYLRRAGYDVVEVGDHHRFDVEHSSIIDRVGDLEAALQLAAVLGIPAEQVRQEIRPDLYLDASVIVGKDYEQLRPFQ